MPDKLSLARDIDLHGAFHDMLQSGNRAIGTGLLLEIRGRPYMITFVRYQSTMNENIGGRYN